MANTNIANIRAPKAPNLPIPPVNYSQSYLEVLTNVLRLYFNQLDKYTATLTTPDLGFFLNTPYGVLSDSTDQPLVAINTPQAVTFNTTDLSFSPPILNGSPCVFIDPTVASRIIISYFGVYNFQFSLHLESTNASSKTVYVWARLNGVDVPNSATKITMSGSNNYQVAAWNFVLETLTLGEYFELMWAGDNINVALHADVASALHPAIPSVILTVTQASA